MYCCLVLTCPPSWALKGWCAVRTLHYTGTVFLGSDFGAACRGWVIERINHFNAN